MAIFGGISWATPFFILGCFGLVSFFKKYQSAKKPESERVHWTGWEAAGVAVFIYFTSQLIGTLIAYVYPTLKGWSSEQAVSWFQDSVFGQFWLILFIEIMSVGLLYLFLRRRKSSLSTIGLKGKPALKDLGYVIIGYGAYFFFYIIAITLVKHLIPSIDLDQQQEIGFKNAHHLQLLPVFASLVILPPIAEELLMRGFLYSGFKNAMPKIWAIVATSALFAVAHLQAGSGAPLLWVAAVDTFVLSVVLIQLKEKSGGRLWAPMGLHALKNLVAFMSLFVFHVVK